MRILIPCLKDGLKDILGERKNGSLPSVVAFRMPSSARAFLMELLGVQFWRPSWKSHWMLDEASCALSAMEQTSAKSRVRVLFMAMSGFADDLKDNQYDSLENNKFNVKYNVFR